MGESCNCVENIIKFSDYFFFFFIQKKFWFSILDFSKVKYTTNHGISCSNMEPCENDGITPLFLIIFELDKLKYASK